VVIRGTDSSIIQGIVPRHPMCNRASTMILRFSSFLAATAAVLVACSDDGAGALHGYPSNDGDPHDEASSTSPQPDDDPSIGAVEDAGAPDPQPTVDAGVDAGPTRADSPVPGKVVTYPYGVKNSSYAAGYHTGDDYATPTGSMAVAVRSGKIAWSNDNGGAYGKWMGLEADNGRTYVYCHLSTRLLSAGAVVTAGQQIAKTGATGNVTGPHLHFEDHPAGKFVYGQDRKPSW